MRPRRRHSTVPVEHPPRRPATAPPPRRPEMPSPPPARQVARIIDQSDSSLLDVLDNLLNRGVVVNADLILALANVDLVYMRLSALLCAADRVLSDDAGE
jgi:gas vesicle protein GvpA/GvpJ/GvpM family